MGVIGEVERKGEEGDEEDRPWKAMLLSNSSCISCVSLESSFMEDARVFQIPIGSRAGVRVHSLSSVLVVDEETRVWAP